MDCNEVSGDATVHIKFAKPGVVTFVDKESECGICTHGEHAISNGSWNFPALPRESGFTASLAERPIESIDENASQASRNKNDALPTPGNEVHERSWRVSDDDNALFFCGKGCILDFEVDSSKADPEYEIFRHADGKLTLSSYWLNYKQFILQDGWQIGVRDTAPDSMAATGSPINFWVVRSPYAKHGEIKDVRTLRSATTPIFLATDPTTLLYEISDNYLDIGEGYVNHPNFKIYWMENEQRNICGIVVGTGNSVYIRSTSSVKSLENEI